MRLGCNLCWLIYLVLIILILLEVFYVGLFFFSFFSSFLSFLYFLSFFHLSFHPTNNNNRRFDLATLGLAIDPNNPNNQAAKDPKAGPGTTIGSSFTVSTEEEKILNKLKQKADKKNQKKGGGGGGDKGVKIALGDKVVLSRLKEELRQLTLPPLEWAPSGPGPNTGGMKAALPANTIHLNDREKEEFIIPAPPARFQGEGDDKGKGKEGGDSVDLIPISEFDGIGQLAFRGYESLNRVQSKGFLFIHSFVYLFYFLIHFTFFSSLVFHAAYHSNENLLICAPTGAGKTNVAMMTILQEVKQNALSDVCPPFFFSFFFFFFFFFFFSLNFLLTERSFHYEKSIQNCVCRAYEGSRCGNDSLFW